MDRIFMQTSEKQFLEMLNEVNKLRECIDLSELNNFEGICCASDIDDFLELCSINKKELKRLVVIDIENVPNIEFYKIDLLSINSIKVNLNKSYFLYLGTKKYTWEVFEPTCKLLSRYGIKKFYINKEFDVKYKWINESYMNYDYFLKNIQRIITIYDCLDDLESKKTFLSVIKARLEKEIGYFPISPIDEYFHPEVKIEQGNTIIDAGIGSYLDPTFKFAKIVGRKGKVLSFEPSKPAYEKASNFFKKYNNIQFYNLGIYDQEGLIDFEETNDDGAHIAEIRNTGRSITQYRMTSIDIFYNKNQYDRCDFIKLDVEGAELKALYGARETIKKYSPKLAVCVYHMPCEQLIDICDYMMKQYPFYTYYMLHHSPHYIDTILYAKKK